MPATHMSECEVLFDDDIYYDVGWGDPERFDNNNIAEYYLNQ